MTPEERIAQLELEVVSLKKQAAATSVAVMYMAGSTRAFELAVLALLSSSKHPEAIERAITFPLNRMEAELVCESMSEEQLEGAQSAKDVLIAALLASRASCADPFPAGEQVLVAECESGGLLH
jgi:hypothetical protein